MAVVYTKQDQGRYVYVCDSAPVHSANSGDTAVDVTNGILYIYTTSWGAAGSGGTAWGDITGTLSSQTDLYLVITELSEAISAKSDKLITENAQSGASYTLVLSDANKLVSMNNGSGNTLTVPNNTDVAFPIGTQILVKQKGEGATTFSPGAGVTIESYLNKVVSLGQYSLFTLIKTDTNTWSLGGNLT